MAPFKCVVKRLTRRTPFVPIHVLSVLHLFLHDTDQVVGAGRGPLVRATLNAGATAGRTLKVYAVEKNPNAVITLRNRAVMDKWDDVSIIAKDMRHWVRHIAR